MKWKEEDINKYLFTRTFSLNSKVPGNPISKNFEFKANLVAANIVNNNFPNINEVKGEEIKNVDLLTYSFPCQGLSIANMGRDKGIKEDSDSTSNLVWQIRRILLDADSKNIKLPKYLLMENVKNLLSKKHKPDYDRWLAFLDELGYKTNTIVLNGFDHGSLQKRERVFAISTLNSKDKTTDDQLSILFKDKYKNRLSTAKREELYKNILTSSPIDEIINAIPNNTPSRHRMANENVDLLLRDWKGAKGGPWTFNTLTTKQDRNPNIGMISLDEKLSKSKGFPKRFITPREAYQIMGFDSEDFSRVKEKYEAGIISKEALYRQAGNSIVVPVLEDIFKYIYEMENK